jgi:hypothetical protein
MYERTRVLVRHGPRLFHQVNLETNEEFHFTAGFPGYGNHSQEVHERLTTSPVVNQANLCFCAILDHVLEVIDRVIIDVVALDARLNFTIRGLEEATISSKNHVPRVTGKSFEILGTIHDRDVVQLSVTHDKGTGQINRANIDLGIRPARYSHLNFR